MSYMLKIWCKSNPFRGLICHPCLGGWMTGMVGLAPKWVRLAPNGTNPGLFQLPRQMHLNLIWKSPGFVPFAANLTHYGAKPTIPDGWFTEWEQHSGWLTGQGRGSGEDRTDNIQLLGAFVRGGEWTPLSDVDWSCGPWLSCMNHWYSTRDVMRNDRLHEELVATAELARV